MIQLKHIDSFKIVLFVIIFVPVCRYSLYLQLYPLAETCFSILRFVSWFLAVILYLKHPKFINSLDGWLLAFCCSITCSSILQQSDSLFSIFSFAFDIIIIWVLLRLYLPIYSKTILLYFIFSYCFCIYLNFGMLFLYPEGFEVESSKMPYYLLGGNYNQMGGIIVPTLAIYGFYTYKFKQGKLNFILLSVISLLTLLYVGSMTSIIGVSLMICFYFVKSSKIRKIIIPSFVIFYLIFQIIILLVPQDLSTISYATYFIENILQKDMSFTNRTEVWNACITKIKESPIIGHGLLSSDYYVSFTSVRSAHNLILSILLTGGILALLLFCAQIICLYAAYLKNDNFEIEYLFVGFWVFMFMMIMEVYPFPVIAWLMLIIYNAENFHAHQAQNS